MIIKPSQLRKARILAGLTQKELAKASGISQPTISKIESGKVDPLFSVMERLTEALKRSGKERTASEIMTRRVRTAKPYSKSSYLKSRMKKFGISQMPVIENNVQIGCVTESDLLEKDGTAREVMGPPLPIIPPESRESTIRALLKSVPAVLVEEKGRIVGIITKSDLL